MNKVLKDQQCPTSTLFTIQRKEWSSIIKQLQLCLVVSLVCECVLDCVSACVYGECLSPLCTRR